MSGERTIRRILITRMRYIGDVVLTTPVLRSVRNAYPEAYIAYLGERHAVSLLEWNPSLNEIIPFDFERPTLQEQTRVARLLRKREFDLAIDLFGNPRTALLTWLSGAPVRVGPDRKGRGRLYTVRVRDDGRPKSAIAFHHQSLAAVGIPASAGRTEIHLTEEERSRGRETISLAVQNAEGARVVGIHPGASWPAKRWPAERFAAVADRCAAHPGVRVVFTVGPKDEETIAAVERASTRLHPVLAGLSLRDLAAVIAGCDVYVSNDAGPMHIAAAVGTPTIGLFGPGEEEIWFPYSPEDGHLLLRKNVTCHPCHLDFCNRTGEGFMECMNLLTVNEVCAAIERTLERS